MNKKDTQNKKYVDFVGSYGPAILGHSNHAVTEAIKKQVEKGLCFGAPSVLEIKLADPVSYTHLTLPTSQYV